MPFHSCLFPVFIPFFLSARANKELHFHLFKFAHTEYKLTRNNFITKGLTCLSNPKRNFHSCCFLHIKEIHKNTLRSFRSKIYFISIFTYRSKVCGEH